MSNSETIVLWLNCDQNREVLSMGLSYLHDPTGCILRITGKGEVSISDRISFFAKLHADSSLDSFLSVIVNVNDITTTPTVEEVQIIARFAGQILARFKGKLAIVNAKVGHVTISHIVEILSGEQSNRVRVCATDEAAIAWIGS